MREKRREKWGGMILIFIDMGNSRKDKIFGGIGGVVMKSIVFDTLSIILEWKY